MPDKGALRPVDGLSARPGKGPDPVRTPAVPAASSASQSRSLGWAGSLYVGSGGVAPGASAIGGIGNASALHNSYFGNPYYGYCSPWYGARPYSYDPFWSLPHWPQYGAWYGTPCWSPWSSPSYCYSGYAYPNSGFSVGYWSHRWSLGFGFNAAYAYSGGWYPCYRTYRYLPYYYYSTVSYYPVYSTVYVNDVSSTYYVDASDPYVEFVDEAPTVAETASFGPAPTRLAASALPAAFASPLVPEYPAGLSLRTYVERADREFAAGRFWDAAEARRRAWLADPSDPAHPLGLGHALFAAGRYELSATAYREGVSRGGAERLGRADLVDRFGSVDAYRSARLAAERRVVEAPSDVDARFSLAVAAFATGDWFAARTEFNALGAEDAAAEALRVDSERRLLEAK